MTSFAEIDVVYAITEPVAKGQTTHSVEPLLVYLRDGGPITGHLRDALVNLLDKNGHGPWQMKLVRRDTRFVMSKSQIDRHTLAFRRVQRYTNAIMTGPLLRSILRSLPGWELKQQGSYLLFQRHQVTEMRIASGKPLSKTLAIRIAAFQANMSFEAAKKMVRATEAALRVE
jgi:hypothetical protein